jgi:hypothetical protein
MGVAVMPVPQPTRYLLYRVAAYGVSATGDPYADLVLIHPQGGTCKAKAFSSCFGDLNELHAYEGAEVNVQLTPTGLQLRPIAEQTAPGLEDSGDPAPEQGMTADRSILDSDCAFFFPEADPSEPPPTPSSSTIATVQEVAATVARLARDFELPTVMWVHLPVRHDRSSDQQRCPQRHHAPPEAW